MSNQKRQIQQNSSSKEELPLEVIEKFIQVQEAELITKSQELKVREKEIEANTKLAEKQMTLQAELLKNQPGEYRKNFVTLGYFVVGIILIIVVFLGFCLYLGKEDFASKIFGYLMYGIVGIASYYFGRKSKDNKQNTKSGDIDEAEVIN
ncbi:MAG: hypothetical protein MH132_08785 [Hydrotalea sp.]|nr:hypothetical protein [Hydrotalea sp.]